MGMVDFLAAALSESIIEDAQLQRIYGDLPRNALVVLEMELLLFAFSDDQQQDRNNAAILKGHCELGLMMHPSFFDNLLVVHLKVMYECIVDEGLLLRCANQFAELRPLLQGVHIQMRLSAIKKKSFAATLTAIIEEETDSESSATFQPRKQGKPSIRRSLRLAFLRRPKSLQ